MRAFDTLGMCLRHMFKRKLRTFLTILGVMVGTAAIVLMLSLGLAQEAQFTQMMENMQQDMTIINVSAIASWMMWTDDGIVSDAEVLLDDDAFDMFSNIPGVRVASPMMRGQVFFRSGRYTMHAWGVTGMRAEALQLMGYDLQEGRLLEPGDGYAAVFGAFGEGNFNAPMRMVGGRWEWRDRAWEMWQGDEYVETFVDIFNDRIDMSYDQRLMGFGGGGQGGDDDEIEIDDDTFRPIRTMSLDVVGLLEPTGDWNVDMGVIMDIDVLHSLNERASASRREQAQEAGHYSAIRGGRDERITYDQGIVRVFNMNDTSRVAEQIRGMGFNANYAGQFISMMREQQQGLQAMLAAIAAVSLFVAALGIANTMIMAVYERTREIGIMKVIGASIKDVRRLFLLEAALIGFFGGLFGIGLSLIGSYLINNADMNLMGMGGDLSWMWGMEETTTRTSLVTPWLCGLALAFSSVIGLFSGYFPARRATKLSALAAIRTE